MKKRGIPFAIALLIGVANAASSPVLTHQPIVLAKHQTNLKIEFRSNPTTGYRWRFLPDRSSSHFRLLQQRYFAPTSQLAGAPGREVFYFKCTSMPGHLPDKSTLVFAYARPWLPLSRDNQVINVIVTAKK